MSFLAPVLAIGGALVKGAGALSASRANARGLEQQSDEELRAGVAQEADLRVAARAAIGEQLAAQGSNGFMGGTGSALDTLRESQINAALDVLRIRREASVKASTLRAQAKDVRRQGVFSAAGALIGGASSLIGMKQDWASASAGSSVASGAYKGGIVGDGSNMTGGISRTSSSLVDPRRYGMTPLPNVNY